MTGIINPNTQHQRWSRWTFHVITGRDVPYTDARSRFVQMARRHFGTNGQARVDHYFNRSTRKHVWVFEVMVDTDHPHDPQYSAYMRRGWTRFFTDGFGLGTDITIQHVLLAGDWQDGRPASQVVMMNLASAVPSPDVIPEQVEQSPGKHSGSPLLHRFMRLLMPQRYSRGQRTLPGVQGSSARR